MWYLTFKKAIREDVLILTCVLLITLSDLDSWLTLHIVY